MMESLILSTVANSQRIAISGTSALTVAVGAATAQIGATVDCYVLIGQNPTALADGTCQFVPAGQLIPVKNMDPTHKIAVITTGGTGYFHITPRVVQ